MPALQQVRQVNPFAPIGYQGTPNGAPSGYFDVGHDYVYNLAAILANATVIGQVSIDLDSDFVWRVITNNDFGGLLRFRFTDANDQRLSSDFVFSASLNTVIFPELLFPAGSRIGVETQEIAGIGMIDLQLCFRGAKRYRIA